MKKPIYLVLSILIIVLAWIGFYYMGDRGVDFDPMTEKYLKEELQTMELSKNLVQSVEKLDLSNRNLTSIEGLEHFTSLKELNLSGNVIADATPLYELKELVKLDLSFNQLTELKIESTNIESLNLEANRLDSLDFVIQLENLSALNIRANDIVDLTPLQGLSSLQALNIRGNKVRTLEVLKSSETLMDLNARNNQISSIEPIVDLPLHKRLYLTGNDISDLNLLKDKLKTIDEIDFEIGVPKPEFLVASGVYTEPFNLGLETDEGYEIYYTLDGTKPTMQSKQYDGLIEISKELMLNQPIYSNTKTSPLNDGYTFSPVDVKKAITVTAASFIGSSRGGQFSESVTNTYVLEPSLFGNTELPVISLTLDPKDLFDEYEGIYVPGAMYKEDYEARGNYTQRGKEFEKKGTLEYFNVDGTPRIMQNVGVRINGSYTRRLPQKSLRIYPRSEYGQSRIYSRIFEDLPYDEFNLLVLRNSGNDNNSTLMRDGLMHELVKDRNVDVQAYQPSIVLLNGEYWGIHNIREKFNEDYIDIKYNVKEEDLVMMTVYRKDGIHFKMDVGSEKDGTHYNELLNYVEEKDMTDEANLAKVETLIDLDNFLEYVSYQVYYANTDSFGNNMTIWRKNTDYIADAPKGHDGRWRWMLFDLDWGMGYGLLNREGDPITYNMFDYMFRDDESVKLFQNLMENDDVQTRFIEVMLDLLNSNFKSNHVHEKIDELADVIRPEIPESIARWENIESVEKWEENIEVLHEFAEKRPAIVREQILKAFNLTENELDEIEKQIIIKEKSN